DELVRTAGEPGGSGYRWMQGGEVRSPSSLNRIRALREKAARLESGVAGYPEREGEGVEYSRGTGSRGKGDPGTLSPGRGEDSPEGGVYPRVAKKAVILVKDPRGLLPLPEGGGALPVFCGEEKDFEYYVVRRFTLRILERLGRSEIFGPRSPAPDYSLLPEEELDALFSPRKLRGVLETSAPRTGGRMELVSFIPPGPSREGPGIIFLLGKRAVSPGTLRLLVKDYSIVVPCGWPWGADSIPGDLTVVKSIGIFDAAADRIADLLYGPE
ncbi:MAG: hypothetical protein JXB45_03870, partial [Candidatus Krumholzibacteriota bacterium]|nr:hypothetical protein [Candidatus Krumholzibacteriota bacterium]